MRSRRKRGEKEDRRRCYLAMLRLLLFFFRF